MKTKLTIAETITKLEAGFGSIYSKDDVLSILNNLEIITEENKITREEIKDFCNKIKDSILENNDIIDIDNIELSIRYNNQIEIDNVSINESELQTLIDNELLIFFKIK